MSIQKKSLISALKTTKKANVASAPLAESAAGHTVTSARKAINNKKVNISAKHVLNNKSMAASAKSVNSMKKL